MPHFKAKMHQIQALPSPLAEPELGAILVMRGNVGEEEEGREGERTGGKWEGEKGGEGMTRTPPQCLLGSDQRRSGLGVA